MTYSFAFIVFMLLQNPSLDSESPKERQAAVEQMAVLGNKEAIPKLAAALKPGGMVPELRGQRLKEIAMRVLNEFGGDLRAALASVPISAARKLLKKFPNIADPGADRILLFAGISPIAAVPSNCAGVLLAFLKKAVGENYSATYREEQRVIATELPDTFDARTRAYLLLKRHGQQLCKRTNPKCPDCPLRPHCAYAALDSLA